MKIRLRISKLLEERHMTPTDFSKKANVAYKTALDLSKDRPVQIRIDTLERVCDALNCMPADVFEVEK